MVLIRILFCFYLTEHDTYTQWWKKKGWRQAGRLSVEKVKDRVFGGRRKALLSGSQDLFSFSLYLKL